MATFCARSAALAASVEDPGSRGSRAIKVPGGKHI